MNGDGILDVVSANYLGQTVSVSLGKGDGTLSLPATAATTTGAYSVALADLNGDGVLDIVTANGATSNTFLGKTKNGVAPILNFSLRTKSDSRQSMGIFDNKLTSLISQRGVLGAFQSRIETATDLLRNETENFREAESRIRDVDVASASAELTRRSILQPASVAVLAQANQQPAIALNLLKT